MFSTLRTRFGIPGVISVMALVFAMFGGAYAASNSSGGGKATASAKAKQGPRGKTGKTGPAGPAGPQGPAGPAGAKGDAGAPGAAGQAGAPGANGASVTVSTVGIPGEEGKCVGLGGAKFAVGASKSYACNGTPGEDGSPWTANGTLPKGSTEQGAWNVVALKENDPLALGSISFTVPLTEGLDTSHVHYVKTGETAEGNCTGSVLAPTAASGHLCVYEGLNPGALPLGEIVAPDLSTSGAGQSGAILFFRDDASSNQFIAGSWAVTG